MSELTPPTCRTTNWRACNSAPKQRSSLHVRFDPETVWLAALSGKQGCPATFTEAAMQACLTLQALFGLPLRETTGLVESWWKQAGRDWSVPNFSTLSRRQKCLNITIPYRPSTPARHLPIDSTGIKAEGEGMWFDKKHGPLKPRQWRKVHPGIDADTLEIRAIGVTGSRVGDAPILPELPGQIPADQPIGKAVLTELVTLPHAKRLSPHPKAETRSSAPPDAPAARSGGNGAGIIDEVLSQQKCVA